jgi:type III restriction enzyme
MELKEYQQTALDTFDAWLDRLSSQKSKADQVAKLAADAGIDFTVPNFPEQVWETMRREGRLPPNRLLIPYFSRTDGLGNPLPTACLKIPTGGGKTLIGAHAVSRILGKYLGGNRGFLLWIVPNEAIYAQTKRQLADRQHPIRQILDRAAAGRVKLLEKDDPLNVMDTESQLCVMLLMLQSANRVTKEQLRFFRDRGNVHGFFPAEGDAPAHAELIKRVPNLDHYDDPTKFFGPQVKDSLGNVLRLLRPVVVMDEGHRAYTKPALDTIAGFNPSILLELSATPKETANWLVDVRGTDLQAAEMIKLPMNVKVKPGEDWKSCLRESLEETNRLQSLAEKLRASSGRYLRPILPVQVERTGKEQRESGKIHIEEAREYLLTLGLDKPQIAAKTADMDELETPENRDLLSPLCPVRVILTKQALQEGWDCPFAYVLCALATNRNLGALTQLAGRILRQPEAKRIAGNEFEDLNQCYVFSHSATTHEVVTSIKKGLENDGMGDVVAQVREWNGSAKSAAKRKLERRESFRGLKIFLPTVNWAGNGEVRPLDYERDILSRLDWSAYDPSPVAERIKLHRAETGSHFLRLDYAREGAFLESVRTTVDETLRFDPVYATRCLADIVPNAWLGRAIVGKLQGALAQSDLSESDMAALSGFIVSQLRDSLDKERNRLAEDYFRAQVMLGHIQFRLRADGNDWRMPDHYETDLPERDQLISPAGLPLQKSLFFPAYRGDMNEDEADFACYADGQAAIEWWHRNVARRDYFLQGWQKNKVYPDFLFAYEAGGGKRRLAVWELKGEHLKGDDDSLYKAQLLQLMSENFSAENLVHAGELELVATDGTIVSCEMVLIENRKTRLDEALST